MSLFTATLPFEFIDQFNRIGGPGLQRADFANFKASDSERILNFEDFDKDGNGTITEDELVSKFSAYAFHTPLTVTYVEGGSEKKYYMYGQGARYGSQTIVGCGEMREEEGGLRVNTEIEYHYYVRMSRVEGERQLQQLANDPAQTLEEAWVYLNGFDQAGVERSYWFEIGVGEQQTLTGLSVEIAENEIFNALITSNLKSFTEISLYHFHPGYFPAEEEPVNDVTDKVLSAEALSPEDINAAVSTGNLLALFDLATQYDARLIAPYGRWMVKPHMDKINLMSGFAYENLEVGVYRRLTSFAKSRIGRIRGIEKGIEKGERAHLHILTANYAGILSLYLAQRYGDRIAVTWNPLPPLQ